MGLYHPFLKLTVKPSNLELADCQSLTTCFYLNSKFFGVVYVDWKKRTTFDMYGFLLMAADRFSVQKIDDFSFFYLYRLLTT